MLVEVFEMRLPVARRVLVPEGETSCPKLVGRQAHIWVMTDMSYAMAEVTCTRCGEVKASER